MYSFKFADIGEGIHEGTILKWNFKVGDKVKEGDTLVVVETDKVNAELPSPVHGTIHQINFKEGDDIHVGDIIVVIDDGTGGEVEASAVKEEIKEEPKVAQKAEPKKEPQSEKGAAVVGEIEVSDEIIGSSYNEVKQTSTEKILASPVARKLASDLKVDLKNISGTGPQGRVLKEDILNQNKAKGLVIPSFKQPEGEVEIVKVSRLRRAISNAMTTSKQMIPHTVLFDSVNVDKLVDFRNEAKVLAEKQGVKLTYMAFISKAVAIAIKEFPVFNSSFDPEKGEIYLKRDINIGIAVDTPDGLIVPNVKQVDKLSLFELANEINDKANKAINRTLALPEQQNGTFTITNFGSIGVPYGTPIINYPEVAILGIGKITRKPCCVEGDTIKIGNVLPLSLGVDHRIIDGADAGRFINRVKELLASPTLLMLS